MKYLVSLFIVLMPSFCLATGGSAEEATLQKTCIDEIAGQIQVNCRTNVNLLNVTTATFTNATISTATVSYLSGATATFTGRVTVNNGTFSTDAVAFGQLKVLQTVVTSVTGQSQTASQTFQATGVTASITPSSTNSKVLILISGEFVVNSNTVGHEAYLTVFRNSTNLGDTSTGFKRLFNTVSAATTDTAGDGNIIYMDSPATTSATTYTAKIRTSNAACTASFPLDTNPSSIVLMEIAP